MGSFPSLARLIFLVLRDWSRIGVLADSLPSEAHLKTAWGHAFKGSLFQLSCEPRSRNLYFTHSSFESTLFTLFSGVFYGCVQSLLKSMRVLGQVDAKTCPPTTQVKWRALAQNSCGIQTTGETQARQLARKSQIGERVATLF
jgi:hypothetical protein